MTTAIISRKQAQARESSPRLVSTGHYKVDSATGTLLAYNVTDQEGYGNWQCDCMTAYYGRTCWHVTAVLAACAATQAPEMVEDLAAITEHLQQGSPEPVVKQVKAACPVCKGSCLKHQTFCFKCNGRGAL